MTPKEKAKELLALFIPPTLVDFSTENFEKTRQCALICVDEILSIVPYKTYKQTISPYDGAELSADYWQEVKTEIEKL